MNIGDPDWHSATIGSRTSKSNKDCFSHIVKVPSRGRLTSKVGSLDGISFSLQISTGSSHIVLITDSELNCDGRFVWYDGENYKSVILGPEIYGSKEHIIGRAYHPGKSISVGSAILYSSTSPDKQYLATWGDMGRSNTDLFFNISKM